MREKFYILFVVVFIHALSYSSSDSLKWRFSFSIGNAALIKKQNSFHYRTEIPASWRDVEQHDYIITPKNSYFNPRVAISVNRALKIWKTKYNKLRTLNFVAGLDYFSLQYDIEMLGTYYGGIAWRSFEGQISQKVDYRYMALRLGFEFSHTFFDNTILSFALTAAPSSLFSRNSIRVEKDPLTPSAETYESSFNGRTRYPFSIYALLLVAPKLSYGKLLGKHSTRQIGVFIEYCHPFYRKNPYAALMDPSFVNQFHNLNYGVYFKF